MEDCNFLANYKDFTGFDTLPAGVNRPMITTVNGRNVFGSIALCYFLELVVNHVQELTELVCLHPVIHVNN